MDARDRRFMKRALKLAEAGRGFTHPNPMVGAVVARGSRVFGEGAHRRFGGPHAEVEAIRRAGRKARGATLYVTLEPCAHFGKTPPCTGLIRRSGLARVVFAAKDPNSVVDGRGASELRRAGIQVESGAFAREASALNAAYEHRIKTDLPYGVVKFAQSLDGFTASPPGRSKWISGVRSRREAHRLRAASDAILVGMNTVIEDDPSLNVRGFRREVQPLKVVLCGRRRCPKDAKIFSKASPGAVLAATGRRGGRVDVKKLFRDLGKRGITQVLVEGGAETIASIVKAKLAQEMHVFIAPVMFGAGRRVTPGQSAKRLAKKFRFKKWSAEPCGKDLYVRAFL